MTHNEECIVNALHSMAVLGYEASSRYESAAAGFEYALVAFKSGQTANIVALAEATRETAHSLMAELVVSLHTFAEDFGLDYGPEVIKAIEGAELRANQYVESYADYVTARRNAEDHFDPTLRAAREQHYSDGDALEAANAALADAVLDWMDSVTGLTTAVAPAPGDTGLLN